MSALRCARGASCIARRLVSSSNGGAPAQQLVPTIAVVGSGPAAFYTAQQLLKLHPSLQVDLLEQLPVPFGLVRYGVAPDHPEVKNVINGFTKIARDPRLAFFGNVRVGADVGLGQLMSAYTAVVLAYGASRARRLGVPGEDSLANVVSARDFVNWYNGYPGAGDLRLDLSAETALIVGQGNVALDVARILLSDPDRLRRTDAPEPVLRRLATESRVRRVRLVGRRGLLQAAFTTKEFRELAALPGVGVTLEGCTPVPADVLASLPRPRRRLTELVLKSAANPETAAAAPRQLSLHFLLSPLEFRPPATGSAGVVGSALFRRNRHAGDGEASALSGRVEPTAETDDLACGLAVVSVGYENVALDPAIPMDARTGIVANDDGRVVGLPNAYCAGWLKTGPAGVLLGTMSESFRTAQRLLDDLSGGSLPVLTGQLGRRALADALAARGVRYTTFDDWDRIDAAERESGRQLGKPREKITSVGDFLRAAVPAGDGKVKVPSDVE